MRGGELAGDTMASTEEMESYYASLMVRSLELLKMTEYNVGAFRSCRSSRESHRKKAAAVVVETSRSRYARGP